MKRQNLRTVALIVATFTYLLFGAALFGYLESDNEQYTKEVLRQLESWVVRRYNISDEDLSVLTTTLIKSAPHKAGTQWKFSGAFYFATTVVTTIGYGHSTPSTMGGRCFCMIYALIGIPLGLVMFQSIGERLNYCVGAVLRYVKRCFKAKNPDATQTNVVAVVLAMSTILMTSMAAVFSAYERWDYFDALYYCFITLTTIGFGDYVALQKDSALQEKPQYVILSLVFILFGLSVVSSAVNLLVLKFLTLNTEDERRDEQLRYTANLNPILLEGDVITPASRQQHPNNNNQDSPTDSNDDGGGGGRSTTRKSSARHRRAAGTRPNQGDKRHDDYSYENNRDTYDRESNESTVHDHPHCRTFVEITEAAPASVSSSECLSCKQANYDDNHNHNHNHNHHQQHLQHLCEEQLSCPRLCEHVCLASPLASQQVRRQHRTMVKRLIGETQRPKRPLLLASSSSAATLIRPQTATERISARQGSKLTEMQTSGHHLALLSADHSRCATNKKASSLTGHTSSSWLSMVSLGLASPSSSLSSSSLGGGGGAHCGHGEDEPRVSSSGYGAASTTDCRRHRNCPHQRPRHQQQRHQQHTGQQQQQQQGRTMELALIGNRSSDVLSADNDDAPRAATRLRQASSGSSCAKKRPTTVQRLSCKCCCQHLECIQHALLQTSSSQTTSHKKQTAPEPDKISFNYNSQGEPDDDDNDDGGNLDDDWPRSLANSSSASCLAEASTSQGGRLLRRRRSKSREAITMSQPPQDKGPTQPTSERPEIFSIQTSSWRFLQTGEDDDPSETRPTPPPAREQNINQKQQTQQ